MSAMELYIRQAKRQGRDLRSPITNNPMQDRLLPAPQVKNLIERFKEEEETQRMTTQSTEQGRDGESMFWLGVSIVRTGTLFEQDGKSAYDWFQKAINADFTDATTAIGLCHAHGI